VILVSNKPVAAYLYCPPGKHYDFELLTDGLMEKLTAVNFSSDIQEVYADGWDDIPNGLSELISDVKAYSTIILYTLEGITIDDIAILVNGGCTVYCAMTPHIGSVLKSSGDNFKALTATINADSYYKDLRSLKIKAGMKNTDKYIGNIPFGHKRKDDGTIEAIPEKIKLAQEVGKWYTQGIAVSEITYLTEGQLSARQVYALMNFWGVKRGN
tara:strand:- start:2698 stop:3336 length:639 start_codon:yes stop_codon:yes gene_type:complete